LYHSTSSGNIFFKIHVFIINLKNSETVMKSCLCLPCSGEGH